MAGYSRQDIANNIANGNVIDADDLDNEFNAIDAAFNSTTGHTHNGTAENGAPITVLGPAQDIVASSSLLRPKTTNTVSLGTDSLRYKDLFIEGNADVDGTLNVEGATTLQSTLSVTSNTTVGGNLSVTGSATVSGNTTLGNAATDTVIFAADVESNILPSLDDTYDLGAVGSEWRNLFIDGTANIDTAAVDTANVGTLSVSGNGTITGSLTVVGGINAAITGTATSANTLTTARTIALGGDVSGSASFDGSANITITATVADDSHNHVIANVDGLQTALDGKAAVSHTHIISDVTGLQTALDAKLEAVDLSAYTGDVDITGELVVDSYNETYQSVSSTSNTTTVNCQTGNVFATTLSENTTFVFSNPPASGTAYGFSLRVTQDASASGYTITWPASIDWVNATAPTLTGTASAVDQLVFYTNDGGTTWYGFVSGQAMG
jgi:hypothetical protein